MKKILVTGFEPFGGETINPSWEAVKLIPDVINGAELIKAPVCVEYEKSSHELKRLIAGYAPDAVICCGQAGGRKTVTPEMCAINRDHAEAPDNAGEVRRYMEIIPGGANAYFTSLPVEEMVEKVKKAGVICAPSFSAGTYVCNHIYYTLLSVMEKGLFVHVPFIPQQVEGKNLPAMELCDIAKAVEIIVSVVAGSI